MKKGMTLVLALVVCLCLCACGKTQAVKDAEAAIAAIGTVTSDSGDAIANAEKLYGILTENEKTTVENRLTLVEAKEAYEKARGEIVYQNAKEAYEKLKEVSQLCIDGMDDIYNAWYFGIYDADDTYNFDYYLSLEVSFNSTQITTAREALGISESFAKSNWQYALWIMEEAFTERGDYETINASMAEAESVLQSLTNEYDDYTYYPKLKEYYSSIKAYVEFFTSPSGSFKQLADTINTYENSIRTLESDVGFLFSK